MKIDFDQVRELLSVVSQNDITELTIESGDQKITVKKSGVNQANLITEIIPPSTNTIENKVTASSSANTSKPADAESDSTKLINITSPMVGTFYRSATPSAAPFVEVGDSIAVGQTICIIEAMKLMNDLPAEISGRIVKICAENGSTVEFGQTLFIVEPKK